MSRARVGRRWIKPRPVRLPRAARLCKRVVNLQDDPLGTVLAVPFRILAFHDGECLQHVVGLLPIQPVEVEEGGIQLAPQQKAPFLVPEEWWAIVAAVSGEPL